MHTRLKAALAIAALAIAGQAAAQITFYEREGFEGRSFSTGQKIPDFGRFGFNDRASSVKVERALWEVCEDAGFRGRCVIVRPGSYPNLAALGLNNRVSSVRAVGSNARIDERRYAPLPVRSQVIFFERPGFQGRSFSFAGAIENFSGSGMNNQASSVIVVGSRWELCDGAGFQGRCVVLRPGRYGTLGVIGLNERVSSARAVGAEVRVDEQRYAPPPPVYAYQRRPEEQVFEAPVLSVRAVVGSPEQRCWVEREQVAVPQQQSNVNVPGAVIGAVIGGVLGHQVGGGTGKDLATVGGAVAGAAIGANVDRPGQGQQFTTQNVQRCKNVPSQAHPEYWDVTYQFRGQEHRVQMTSPPGKSVTVNGNGEPRA